MIISGLKKAKRKITSKFSKGNNVITIESAITLKNKKALVSYLISPVIESNRGIKPKAFSNAGAAAVIPELLSELGYEVDVINYDDSCSRLIGNYDLIIAHGGNNYNHLKKYKDDKTKLVYYSTGSYWGYHNKQEKSRFENFYNRHKVRLSADREINNSEEEVNSKADLIISLGNRDTANTYSKFKNVKYLHAASIIEKRKIPEKKFDEVKNNFLFMSGPGAIHKGLDWALDFFKKHPELNLYILMKLEQDFEEYFNKELFESENIHFYGFIPQRTNKYYEIVDKCAFSILLSCSEGSPGSVIESMHQGLIPIVTKDSHIDVGKCGFIIDELTEKSLGEIIKKAYKMNSSEFYRLSKMNTKLIEEEYTVKKYKYEFKKMIKSLEQKK